MSAKWPKNMMEGVEEILDHPLPADGEPGPDGDTMALELAHYLGWLADASDLSPGLAQFQDNLLALSERYWSGLFHCYESLYGQTKRQLRRQLGVSELRGPLLRWGD